MNAEFDRAGHAVELAELEQRMLMRAELLSDGGYVFEAHSLAVIGAALTALAAGQRLSRLKEES